MKKYQLDTKTADILNRFPALRKRLESAERTPASPGTPRVLCLGADLEQAGACIAVQCGLGEPLNLGTLTRETVAGLVPVLRARGWRCVVGMEACGFGWAFQGALRAAGAEALTFATEALTGRRKTNTRDAAALARLVAERTVHGNPKAGRVVREPTPGEQQRRYLTRHRGQLVGLRGRIEGHGRGLLYDSGQLGFPACWWGKKMWPVLTAQLTAAGADWLHGALAPQRAMAQVVHAQILVLDAEIDIAAAQTLTMPLPRGLGRLTALTACLEVMDWQRFHNRKQVGSYIGCAPSEHSTGPGQRLGGCAACLPRPSGGCCAGSRAGRALPSGARSSATPTAARCGKRKPSSPACGCSSLLSGGSSPGAPSWPAWASPARRPPSPTHARPMPHPSPTHA